MLGTNDVLVLNNTKVIPARFYGTNDIGKRIEILLVNSISPDNLTWKILAKPKKYLIRSNNITITDLGETTSIKVIAPETIRFNSHNDLELILTKIGEMPLPPYIKREREKWRDSEMAKNDFERYQTVFAKVPGAVAAPTAALHFTEELLNKIKKQDTEILDITLHVGPGTFLPVRTNDIRDHKLIPEYFYIENDVWDKIKKAKENKKRIIACGTTTVRVLEYVPLINKLSGLNNLYITPGFQFQIVDAIITNFHLPKTTLLTLISAFIGWDNVKKIYEEAIKERYRFYSYGDAMFIN